MRGVRSNNLAWAAPVVALGLVVAMVSLDKLHLDPAEAASYHRHAADAINAMPKSTGNWRVAAEFPMDPDANKLLQVNAYLHRVYRNIYTGQSVELLLVQCRDARSLQGHFPPVCYASNGCAVRAMGTPQKWSAKGRQIPGIEYEITRPNKERFIVRDFFVLPNGKFAYDMDSVIAAAKNYQELVYGGAQVQLVYSADYTAAQRDAIFSDLMGSYCNLLDELRGAQWKDASPRKAT